MNYYCVLPIFFYFFWSNDCSKNMMEVILLPWVKEHYIYYNHCEYERVQLFILHAWIPSCIQFVCSKRWINNAANVDVAHRNYYNWLLILSFFSRIKIILKGNYQKLKIMNNILCIISFYIARNSHNIQQ